MQRSDERVRFLADIIVCAVEGGTNYWARAAGYRWSDEEPSTTQVLLIDMEQEGEFRAAVREKAKALGHKLKATEAAGLPGSTFLDIDAIASALGKIKRGEAKLAPGLTATIKEADRENDAGDIDADGADCIAQIAAFGEVVYG